MGAQPMGAGGERGLGRLAGMDRAVVEHDDDGSLALAGFGAVAMIEFLQKGDEVGAALGFGGGDDQPVVVPVERAHHRDLSGLAGCLYAEVCAALGPGTGEIGVGQRLALVGKQQDDVTGRGLRLAQDKPQADVINLVRALTALQRVPGPPEAEPAFLRSTFENCEREMLRPSRRAISSARRDNVLFRRSSTGADRSADATLRAACAFSGAGPGAMCAQSVRFTLTPPVAQG